MSQIPPARETFSADESLPPVEPPSAGFILQLFVVPAVIVIIIIAVWFLFNWLAHMGDNPRDYVKALARGNVARWQAAVNLANALRRENSKLKDDTQMAEELSKLLAAELETTGSKPSDDDIRLQAYLCNALGEFNVPAGLPVLLDAAGPKSDLQIRRAALESIARLSANAGRVQPLADPRLDPVLLGAAADDESGIREAAAYTLGVLGGPERIERLALMVDDGAPNVRYNAATGLARWGDVRSTPVLVEMLDPEQPAGVASETNDASREFKRYSILNAGLQAARHLSTSNLEDDLGPLAEAVQRLSQADVARPVQLEAQQVQYELKARGERLPERAGVGP